MGRYHSYINTSLHILRLYNGEMPFSIFIKQFFSKEKKYGSKDRKQIAALCYSYFRIGLALNKQLSEDSILTAFFVVNTEPSLLIQNLKPEWNDCIDKSIEEKLKLIQSPFDIRDIFPFVELLSETINIDAFCQSIVIQPDLFVRIRPQNKENILEKIKTSGHSYLLLDNDNCVQFSSGINIETFLLLNKEVVIQDYNSQQVLNHIKLADYNQPTAWDCCAASGGKSILLYDRLNGKVKLTVSDIRQSIIANLQQRFAAAEIKNYNYFVADICSTEKPLPAGKFDIIVCDAPCTGSGTWSRTPEQLYYFDPSSIDVFAKRQKKIAANVLPHLHTNGLFFYITCSVFKEENEEMATFISQQKGMELIEMKTLFGHDIKADSMFVAVYKKASH